MRAATLMTSSAFAALVAESAMRSGATSALMGGRS